MIGKSKASLIQRRSVLAGAATMGVAWGSLSAAAQERVKSGTVEIEQVQVAFIGSGGIGGGTLHFRDRSYRFSIGGLGIGGFGVSRMEGTGDVYNLRCAWTRESGAAARDAGSSVRANRILGVSHWWRRRRDTIRAGRCEVVLRKRPVIG